MATAVPVHKFCEVIFFLQKKEGKKFEQSQSIRTDYYLIGAQHGAWVCLIPLFVKKNFKTAKKYFLTKCFYRTLNKSFMYNA